MDKKVKFRLFKGAAERTINPRTGQDDGKSKVESTPNKKQIPCFADPWQLIGVFQLCPWLTACKKAIASAVAATQIAAVFKPPQKGDTADPTKIKLLKDFLEKDSRDFKTVSERIKALATDFVILDYMCIEIARDVHKIPSAWYHVPAVTIREKADGGYVQIDANGKTINEFAPYQPGGNKESQSELIVIKEYDPSAKYMSAMDVVSLLETANRLSNQDSFNNQMLKANNVPPLLLLLKESLDEDSYRRFSEFVNSIASGATDAIGVVDGIGEGKLEKMASEISEAGYVESEKLLRERILAVMQVPPSKLGLPVVNYAVAQQEDATFRFSRILPIVDMILHRLNIIADEIVPDDGYGYVGKPLTYEDYLQIAQAENMLVSSGIHSRNEARARLGDDGIGEEGDIHTIANAMGLTPLENAVNNGTPTMGRAIDSLMEIRRILAEGRREDTKSD